MKAIFISPETRRRASRLERLVTLLRLWRGRPGLLWSLLTIEGAPAFFGPSVFKHRVRWLDLTSRMMRPFCCVTWDVDQKVERIVDHHRIALKLGGDIRTTWAEPRKLTDLAMIGPDYSIKIDEACWMIGDGLTTVSVWHGIDRMFTVGFVLAQEGSQLIAYVGGLQGRSEEGVLQLYRQMTKDAYGLRPRDLMIEVNRMVCRALGVSKIYAVAEMSRNWNDRFSDEAGIYVPSINYDEVWEERGGTRISTDWFSLPLAPQRRDEADIPAKKRSLYRQRYAMLEEMEAAVNAAVAEHVPGSAARQRQAIQAALPPQLQMASLAGSTAKVAPLLAATTVTWLAD